MTSLGIPVAFSPWSKKRPLSWITTVALMVLSIFATWGATHSWDGDLLDKGSFEGALRQLEIGNIEAQHRALYVLHKQLREGAEALVNVSLQEPTPLQQDAINYLRHLRDTCPLLEGK